MTTPTHCPTCGDELLREPINNVSHPDYGRDLLVCLSHGSAAVAAPEHDESCPRHGMAEGVSVLSFKCYCRKAAVVREVPWHERECPRNGWLNDEALTFHCRCRELAAERRAEMGGI